MTDTLAARAAAVRDLLACPACHASLTAEGDELRCSGCGAVYGSEQGVPLLFAPESGEADVSRVQSHYDHVAHEYDGVFAQHVAKHYLDKRLGIIRSLLRGGRVLDVGCGTGVFGAQIAAAGFDVVGVDLSPGM